MDLLLIIIGGLVFIALGYFIGMFQSKSVASKEISSLSSVNKMLLSDKENLSQQVTKQQIENNTFQISLTKKESELAYLSEKLDTQKKDLTDLQEKFTKEFQLLANKILEEKSEKFTILNKENIENILNPLQERILTFEKRVETSHKESIDYHAALRQQIVGLTAINEQMSKEAVNLTRALKGDSKTQGNWGEMILERVLEKSGLEKGREYEVEQSFSVDTEGKQRLRPDVIINLPDNKKMIIDSKVTLTAYEQYVNAENEVDKIHFIKEHVLSINRHVNQLSEKRYEDLYQIESPNFVLLFIPIEPAFALAQSHDADLYNKAFQKNIVIVTPTILLATLSTINSLWQNEKQRQNAVEIARQAGALYDKFEGLFNDLIGIGKKMDDTKKDYESAMNKLSTGNGNLITRVESIKKLGANAKKSLPQSIINRAIE
ncbi:MAG: DNA recombination protein RmuC [Flavobacteriales bacterium CG11_big_fil_rev_8_21_14_0_20_35_7]|nr:MAG: DNA recombination protein RmuC [Flavobacteriales bacterium CG11_big_fil_rev_8_21_14_0_20_35_7]PJA05407.1 MAG: DNA recombination protein RmuC [Flavobacteriales bacterium CG_4_10_14_0_2_um_filter_35_18]